MYLIMPAEKSGCFFPSRAYIDEFGTKMLLDLFGLSRKPESTNELLFFMVALEQYASDRVNIFTRENFHNLVSLKCSDQRILSQKWNFNHLRRIDGLQELRTHNRRIFLSNTSFLLSSFTRSSSVRLGSLSDESTPRNLPQRFLCGCLSIYLLLWKKRPKCTWNEQCLLLYENGIKVDGINTDTKFRDYRFIKLILPHHQFCCWNLAKRFAGYWVCLFGTRALLYSLFGIWNSDLMP